MTSRFNTKQQAQDYIDDKGELAGYFTPTFISDHYALASGVEKGGWYILDSWNKLTD